MKLVQSFLNWLLPPRCPITGALVGESGTLSGQYWSKLSFIQKPFCSCCGTPFTVETEEIETIRCGTCLREPPDYTSARAVLKYDDASSEMILRFKHGDATHLSTLFAQWLDQLAQIPSTSHEMIVMPVPLHRWRLIKRRYNQASLIAKQFAKRRNLPFYAHSLKRTKSTESQGKKTKAARHENVQSAFFIPKKYYPLLADKHVVLIDDVLTSGATVNACARTLYKAGVKEVHVLTICRVVQND